MNLLLRHRALGLATAVFLVTTAVAAGLAFAGSLDDRRYAVPLLAVLIATGVFALLGWAGERARREEEKAEFDERTTEHVVRQGQALAETERLSAELSAALARYDIDKQAHDEVESELRARVEGLERAIPETQRDYEARLDRQAAELGEAQRLRADTAEGRRVAREWTANLRSQIAEFERERGPLADPQPLRALVLRAAMTLVAAKRGLLAARMDEAGLGIVCDDGFGSGAEAAARTVPGALDRGLPTRQDAEASVLLTVPFRPAGGPEGALVFADHDPGQPKLPDDALMALAETTGLALHDLRVRQELREAFLATIGVLTDAIEAKDRFMLGHGEEVALYITAVADRLGLEPRRREELVYAALLHDVGKIAVSESILLKPSDLTAEERAVIQLHPRIGAQLVRQVAALHPIGPAVEHHHERWDGTGYPDRLAGDAIPVEARVLAVADAFSAMTADRPYRAALSLDEACAELERCAATQFDPVCVRLFVEEVRRRPPSTARPDALGRTLAELAPDAQRKVSRLPRLARSPFAA
jgi:HD-GYP domain-containing protein (c-di-GMP phosphodiesterase class II)